mmetsp:Transcript_10387/g.42236  ORF Transcript_10387/g.42236 Transcript_10387/m.42236 type:complete len:162 (-) Transcript_10387:414-899(-)
MFVHTPFMKSCECEMINWMPRGFHVFRYSSSQMHDSMSRWFVGSSSSRRVGQTNSARASATRILQPPEKSLHCFWTVSLVKPRPSRIFVALASAVSAPRRSSLSKSSHSFVLRLSADSSSQLANFVDRASTLASSSLRSWSHSSTHSRAVSSEASTSPSTW